MDQKQGVGFAQAQQQVVLVQVQVQQQVVLVLVQKLEVIQEVLQMVLFQWDQHKTEYHQDLHQKEAVYRLVLMAEKLLV